MLTSTDVFCLRTWSLGGRKLLTWNETTDFLAILCCFKNSWTSPESTSPITINIPRGETEAQGLGLTEPQSDTMPEEGKEPKELPMSPGSLYSQHPHSAQCPRSPTTLIQTLLRSLPYRRYKTPGQPAPRSLGSGDADLNF